MSSPDHKTESELRNRLSTNSGDDSFVPLAELLRSSTRLEEAQEVCLKGLSASPSNHRGRLVLARIWFERGLIPFAIRELEQLCVELPEAAVLQRLLSKLCPDSPILATKGARPAKSEPETVIAGAEFDLDILAEGLAHQSKKKR